MVSSQTALQDFLSDLQNANRSPQTLRAYRSDLQAFLSDCPDEITQINISHLRRFFAHHDLLKPATRARKQSAVARFFQWASRYQLILSNPMLLIERIVVDTSPSLPPHRGSIEAIFKRIPDHCLRDRVLFRLIFETGLRVSEALSLYIEDLDLSCDDEHMTVIGKGQIKRTLLLDDRRLVALLKRYLRHCDYHQGPVFRAQKNYQGGALRYQSAQALWEKYCRQAGMVCTLHQLRHAHATELVNNGVSLATIRKRLGHKHLQSTLRYTHLSDKVADAEIRAWRRKVRS